MLGPTHVRTRFIIYRGTATVTARSVQGPLRHLALLWQIYCKRPTNPALAVHCRAWEVCSVIGKLVSTHDDGYGFGWPGASAEMDDL
jgi:hypothetical protein